MKVKIKGIEFEIKSIGRNVYSENFIAELKDNSQIVITEDEYKRINKEIDRIIKLKTY